MGRAFLPGHPIVGPGLGIRVVLAPGLLDQLHGLILILSGMGSRRGKTTPPDFIAKPNRPGGLMTGPGNQTASCFFYLVLRVEVGNRVFGTLPIEESDEYNIACI